MGWLALFEKNLSGRGVLFERDIGQRGELFALQACEHRGGFQKQNFFNRH